jgi:ABC-type Fe3+ transport system substrate-binding protein
LPSLDGATVLVQAVFCITLAGNNKPNVLKFLDWITSKQGQYLVKKTGYCPLPIGTAIGLKPIIWNALKWNMTSKKPAMDAWKGSLKIMLIFLTKLSAIDKISNTYCNMLFFI